MLVKYLVLLNRHGKGVLMDPIADMFSQIKNAQSVKREALIVPFSKIKLAILEILKNHNHISGVKLIEKRGENRHKEGSIKFIEILLFSEGFSDIRRVSRPGRRVYKSSFNIPRPKRDRAITIVSTSKGVLEGEDARRKGLGGEIIAEIR